MIEVSTPHFLGLFALAAASGTVFGFGVKTLVDEWRENRRARAESERCLWTPEDDERLDQWRILP